MLDPDPSKRVRADFFIELHPVITDRTVRKMLWFSKNKFIRRMLEKYQTKGAGIKAVTDFRLMKQHISNARRARKIKAISKRLKEFTEDDSLSLEHLEIKSAAVHETVKRLLLNIGNIRDALEDTDVADYYGEEGLWKQLEDLAALIRAKILEAGRRPK
jgi:hypothetical protein